VDTPRAGSIGTRARLQRFEAIRITWGDLSEGPVIQNHFQ
jgi:hypothetical protein